MQGQKDKREGLAEICRKAGVSPEETAYMGDDIPDLCLFPLVALSCAPSDASVVALKKLAGSHASPADTVPSANLQNSF